MLVTSIYKYAIVVCMGGDAMPGATGLGGASELLSVPARAHSPAAARITVTVACYAAFWYCLR